MASSSLTINFSLRQNKAIERAIAFDALTQARDFIAPGAVYVGLGSLWFQDFQMAHRLLGLTTMVSIEGDASIFKRAPFNAPLRTIEVVEGMSSDVVPQLLGRADLGDRAWVTWLDYDRELNDDRLEELRAIVNRAQNGSVLLATFNAKARNYGDDTDHRREVLTDLFTADYVAPGLPDEAFNEPRLAETLGECLLAYLQGIAIHGGRDGRFVPAVRLAYKDSTYMATVGGFLPEPDRREACESLVDAGWCGFEDMIIETHPLTLRELLALSQLMPAKGALTVEQVAALGFELDEDQLRFYERHYSRYPVYAEIR